MRLLSRVHWALVVIVSMVTFGAWAEEFSCRVSIADKSAEFSVEKKGQIYLATYTNTQGKLVTEEAKFEEHGAAKVRKNEMFAWMAGVLNLDLKDVKSARSYTIGNLEDDLAGIMGVQFFDVKKQVLYKAMIWGWGGPEHCL